MAVVGPPGGRAVGSTTAAPFSPGSCILGLHYFRLTLFPPPTNATNQPLERTTYKLLIRNVAIRGTRGLRPPAGSEAGEKNGPERVKTGQTGRSRETSKSTGTRTNPRKHAGVRKKRPTR